MRRLNEVTWLVVDELTHNWEELRERWKIVVTPSGKEQRERRMISPAELETDTWARYGFDDIDSYYADGHGFIDYLQTVALRTAIESVDWTQVIKQLEKDRGS